MLPLAVIEFINRISFYMNSFMTTETVFQIGMDELCSVSADRNIFSSFRIFL
jgi:hypothetical protein